MPRAAALILPLCTLLLAVFSILRVGLRPSTITKKMPYIPVPKSPLTRVYKKLAKPKV